MTAKDTPQTAPQSALQTATPAVPPVVIYETLVMTPAQIAEQNAAFRAMGVDAVVLDMTPYCGKLERQKDGTFKRVQIRRLKSNDGSNGQSGLYGKPGGPGGPGV